MSIRRPQRTANLLQQKAQNSRGGREKHFRHFAGAFSCRGSTPTASLARFRALRVCARLPPSRFRVVGHSHRSAWRVSGLRAFAQGFPGACSGFSRMRTASLEYFEVVGTLLRLRWRVFGLFACAHGFPWRVSMQSAGSFRFPGYFRA